tara:strand:+ start:3722 stop:4210 length:489 start_codon:yes stop_codon:yes gene_type:complete
MSVINVSAGNEAVLVLADTAANANVATGAVTGLIVPQMQDITINNSTGIFRFKTLDNTAESAVTTPATNQISLNAVVDANSFFGTGGTSADKLLDDGLFGASKAKTRVFFQVAFDGRDSGSKIFTGSGFISGLAPTVNMDSPVWITPVTIEVDGDFTEAALA